MNKLEIVWFGGNTPQRHVLIESLHTACQQTIKIKKKMSIMISSNWIRDTFISTKKLSKQPILQLIRLNPQNPQEEYVLGEFSDTNHFMRCVFTQNAIDNFASNEPERKFTKLNGSLLCLTDFEILNKEYLNFNHLLLNTNFLENLRKLRWGSIPSILSLEKERPWLVSLKIFELLWAILKKSKKGMSSLILTI